MFRLAADANQFNKKLVDIIVKHDLKREDIFGYGSLHIVVTNEDQPSSTPLMAMIDVLSQLSDKIKTLEAK